MSKSLSKLGARISPLALALTLAFPLGAAAASKPAAKPMHEQLQAEIDQLKMELAELKKMVMQKAATPAPVVVQAPPPPAPAPVAMVDPVDFNRIKVKVEAMEDSQESSGFKGFKVSGIMDAAYLFNQRAHRGSLMFLNNQDGGETNDLTQDGWGYDNSNFGGVSIKFEKELSGGVMSMLSLRPRKSATGTGVPNIVEEATLTIPLPERMFAVVGKLISFNGYEYADVFQNKSITHNLLWDFGGPSFITGAGLNFTVSGVAFKTMLGNLNSYRDLPGNNNSGLHWRGDVTLGEFSGWGASGMHGKLSGQRYNYAEADYWYTRGDLTLNAQIEGSWHRNGAFNGGDASHTGVSALAAYKLSPEWEAHIRGDWLSNTKNGGGNPAILIGGLCPDDGSGTATLAQRCGDYRNGFGPGVVFNSTSGLWELGDINRGTKRTALTLGMNYQFHDNGLVKIEYRYDHSDLNSFVDQKDGSYKKSNSLFGVQTVVKF